MSEENLPGLRTAAEASEPRFAEVVRLGVAAQGSEVLQLAVAFAVPAMLVRYAGPAVNGYFQVFLTFSGYVFLLQSSMYAYLFPLASEADAEGALITNADQALRLQLLITIPVVGAISLAAPVVVGLLYSRAFSSAATYLPWIAVPSLAAAFNSVFSVYVLGLGRMRAYLFQNVLKTIVAIGTGFLLIPRHGLVAAIAAVALAPAVEAAIGFATLRRSCGYTLSRRCGWMATTGVAVLMLQYVATVDSSSFARVLGVLPIAVWVAAVLLTDPEISQSVSLVRRRFA
jgi:O-antigen/teichoic acid export membrane protein